MAPGYETYDNSGVPFVMKPKKSIYGLRQSPENWFGTIDGHLSNIDFRSLKSDPCVYVFEDKTGACHPNTLYGWHSSTWQQLATPRQAEEVTNGPFRDDGPRGHVEGARHERHPGPRKRDDYHRPEGLHGGYS